MKFTDGFTVGWPIDAVWALFKDVASVALCMPGAELTADMGDGVYTGLVAVELGPLSPTFEGEATAVYDTAIHEIRLNGSGVDHKGGSRGRVAATVKLQEDGDSTTVSMNADISLSGAAARFGRTGLMEEMASRLIGEFVTCLEAKLAASTGEEAAAVQAEEVRPFSQFVASIGGWFKRLLRRISGRE